MLDAELFCYIFLTSQAMCRVKSGKERMKNRIKEFRGKLDMTQDDLARLVDVRRETILYLEQGKYNPSLQLAHAVAKQLKTSIPELFIFDEELS